MAQTRFLRRFVLCLALEALGAAALSCSRSARTDPAPRNTGRPGRATDGEVAARGADAFLPVTVSPRPAPRQHACGAADEALDAMALRIARRRESGARAFEPAEVTYALRALGSPYVSPVWYLTRQPLTAGAASDLTRQRSPTFPWSGAARCGEARARAPDGSELVATVIVDAVADLSPLPTRVRSGQWLRFEATLLTEGRDAKLVALGPRRTPRAVPTTLHDRRVRATVSLDQSGRWLLQLLADVGGGPRPVLEALVFVDEEPSGAHETIAAPGEDAAAGAKDDRESLLLMTNAARAAEDLRPLDSSADLDALALDHARAMRDTRTLAHDVARGGPVERLQSAGMTAGRLGENVAHAPTIARAHRALWESPSHRANLLDPRFDAVGIGVAHDREGRVWVAQLLADFGYAGIDQPDIRGAR